MDETKLPAPARPATYEMWDQIAEGLEYRHARDCQLYFERTTARFPRDRDLFRYLTTELANVYLKPRKVYWSSESSRLLVATVNSFLQKNKIVDWRFVAKAFNGRYTVDQCESRWRYWSHKQDPRPDQDQEQQQDQQRHQDHQHDDGQRELNTQGEIHMDKVENQNIADDDERRLWSDKELEQLKKGVGEYGHQWARIRDQLLPHRSVQALRERYWRNQAKKTGRFSETERSLLETAIETFGECADWEIGRAHV